MSDEKIGMLLHVHRCERRHTRMERGWEWEYGRQYSVYTPTGKTDQCRRAARWKTASGKKFCEQCRPRKSVVTCLLTDLEFNPKYLNAPHKWPEEIGVEGVIK